jgi:hypothetical protein
MLPGVEQDVMAWSPRTPSLTGCFFVPSWPGMLWCFCILVGCGQCCTGLMLTHKYLSGEQSCFNNQDL